VIVALALLGYAGLLLTVGSAALARARWPESAPRLGIAAWFALTGSAVASVTAGGLALMVPAVRVSAGLARLLAACMMALRAQYAHPGGAAVTGAGAVPALAVLGRVTWCAGRALASAARARRRHRRRLSLVGRPDPRLGAVIVGHHEPAAYCLPGHGSRIVLTTGAVDALDAGQLRAVLAHERAHLRGRHHLLVTLAGALNTAFPRVPAFGIAAGQVARLAELRADDAASSAAHRLAVAGALLNLGAGVPAAALGAGTADAARVRRLINGPAAISRSRVAAVACTAAAAVLVPLVLLTGPAVYAWAMTYCPHGPVPAPASAPPAIGLRHIAGPRPARAALAGQQSVRPGS
jgi:Zn-dependent protease with chaperone function